MKALILNSGMGTRMGEISKSTPKCMSVLTGQETIVSRQLRLLSEVGIDEVVMTTGYLADVLVNYCNNFKMNICFAHNPKYSDTNYIYSIYLAREYLDDDIILMHGDLVFEKAALKKIMESSDSCMGVHPNSPLPQKDFKAVLEQTRIKKIGIEFFESAVAAQPIYKLQKKDWQVWKRSIETFCKEGKIHCYAENAWNEVTDYAPLYICDMGELLCQEVDTEEDLKIVNRRIGDEI